MTPPKVRRHLVCPSHGEWEIGVGENERCHICGVLGEPICACGCRSSLSDLRADAVYRSEACAKRLQRRGRPDIDPTAHPLQAVREDQAVKKHNRDLGGLICQAIIDQIKTTGECFADDLIALYPASEVKECRRLATAQFGSLTARGLIREKERRKSSVPERKGAKSGVYEFTKAGWDRWGTAGVSADFRLRSSREARGVGSNPPVSTHSGDSGLTGPGGGVGVSESKDPMGRVVGSHDTDTASPDNQTLVGSSGGASSDAAAVSGEKASTDVPGIPSPDGVTSSPAPCIDAGEDPSAPSPCPEGSSARLFELDDARERPRSAFADPEAA